MFVGTPANSLPVYDPNPYHRGLYDGDTYDPYEAADLIRAYEFWATERGDDFRDFLKALVAKYVHERLTTEMLRQEFFDYMPERDAAFARFVYGPGGV